MKDIILYILSGIAGTILICVLLAAILVWPASIATLSGVFAVLLGGAIVLLPGAALVWFLWWIFKKKKNDKNK